MQVWKGCKGGVALLYKCDMKLASKSSWKAKSFENIEVTLTASSTMKLAVIYRPLPSKRNKSTVGLFMTEFQDFLEHHTVKSQNILIVGDFNFHYEDPSNVDACRFRDIIANQALCQYVSGSTHMAGRLLDLNITQSVDNIVSNTVVSDFLTDHACQLYWTNMHLFRLEQSRFGPKFHGSMVISRWLSRKDGNWREDGDSHGSQFV